VRPTTYPDEAGRFEAKLARGLAGVRAVGAPLGAAPVEAAVRFLEGFPNRRTAVTYVCGITRYFAWCVERGVDPFTARRSDGPIFVAGMAHLAPKTRDSYVAAVKGFYGAAADDGLTEADPLARYRTRSGTVRTPTPALTLEEFESVLRPLAGRIAASAASLVEERDFALVYVAGRMGARSISMRLLTWAGWLHREQPGDLRLLLKGEMTQTLDVPPDVAQILEAWKAVLEAVLGRRVWPADAVFPRIGSAPELRRAGAGRLQTMTGEALWTIVKGRFRDAGLEGPRLAFHALRATSATVAHEAGATIEEIQHTLGHASPSTSAVYIRRIRRRSAADSWTMNLADRPADRPIVRGVGPPASSSPLSLDGAA
jgi:integrase/recombinase XerD